ncbi:MAG: hypothetical protein O3C48_04565, partial [Crenarchaeota archaeon]|nr:hypothetical protein [Thermoproteota archaeon]
MVRVPIVQILGSKRKNNSSNIDHALVTDVETGEQICKNCGQVLIHNMVDYSYDGFNEDFKNTRTGPKISITIHDGGLSTIIGRA